MKCITYLFVFFILLSLVNGIEYPFDDQDYDNRYSIFNISIATAKQIYSDTFIGGNYYGTFHGIWNNSGQYATHQNVESNHTVLDNRDNAINSSLNIQSFITQNYIISLGFQIASVISGWMETNSTADRSYTDTSIASNKSDTISKFSANDSSLLNQINTETLNREDNDSALDTKIDDVNESLGIFVTNASDINMGKANFTNASTDYLTVRNPPANCSDEYNMIGTNLAFSTCRYDYWLTDKPNYNTTAQLDYRYVPYSNPISNMDWSGKDIKIGSINASGTGFFGWLGNLTNRISKLWATDIDVSGTATVVNLNVTNIISNVNMTSKNITNVGCIIYNSGGMDCTGV